MEPCNCTTEIAALSDRINLERKGREELQAQLSAATARVTAIEAQLAPQPVNNANNK